MKAVELISNTDKDGNIKIEYKLSEEKKNVRVIILYEKENAAVDDNDLTEDYVTGNPAFEFLSDPAEDIYSIDDGNPVH